ncbi:DNA repair protein RecO [Caldimonas sp.]|uniref:DNA repair protein RecO n=1 Tax=Caldimonas sp. TaxID=2838790 RepID=UPI00307F1B0B
MARRNSGGRRHAHRVAGEPAYVLHHYDWSESSLILDLFTRHHGRVVVVAKGAKRPYSQLRPVLLPFQRLLVSYSSRDEDGAEVHTLKAADWAGGLPMPTGAALLTGFYLNELLMKLLARSDAHPRLFDHYAATLPALAGAEDVGVQAALRAFELALLRGIGVLPELHTETLTQLPVQDEVRYGLDAEAGVHALAPGEVGLRGAWLREAQRALALSDGPHGLAAVQQACRLALPELKSVLRGLLHYHLGTPMLRTRQLLMELQQP